MVLGGRVAKSILLNRVTTGARNYLKRVTDPVYNRVKSPGIDPVISSISFERKTPEASDDLSLKPYS